MIWEAHSTLSKFFAFVGNKNFLIRMDEAIYINRDTILKDFISMKTGINKNDIVLDLNYNMEHIQMK
jgi:hypothetical protein